MPVHRTISDVDGFVADLIDKAGIDEYDRDIGTSGLCATFALVLYRCLLSVGINSTIVFLCCTGKNNKISFERGHDGDMRYAYWRHALVRIGNVYFDIDGQVRLKHIIENYCWGPGVTGGRTIDVSPSEAIAILRSDKNNYDERYRNIWVKKLKKGIELLDAEQPN